MKQLIIPLFCFALIGTAYGQALTATPPPASAQSAAAPSPRQRTNRHVKKEVVRPPIAKAAVSATPRQTGNASPPNPKPRQRAPQPAVSFSDAQRRHRRESHDRTWWKARYTTIVFVNRGYYYFDSGYWFPAWGYDPAYDSYDYDGPIYTYGNLLPDQVILNVQRALKQLGYYNGPLTGSLGPSSRAAIAAYQQDAGLAATGAIDAPTVEALGLY